jgi:hypothetical protein
MSVAGVLQRVRERVARRWGVGVHTGLARPDGPSMALLTDGGDGFYEGVGSGGRGFFLVRHGCMYIHGSIGWKGSMTLRWPITRARRLGILPDRIKPSSTLLGHVFMLGRFTCGDLTAYRFGVATGYIHTSF